MVQGGLSETTRQCGKPTCACHSDPSRRHGPHLYLTFRKDGKSHATYIAPEHAVEVREAHAAWARFWEIGCALAGLNRTQMQAQWQQPRANSGDIANQTEATLMIQVRHLQRSFGEGLIAEAVDDLWEDWMRHADELLEDESLINTVYEGLARRCPRSKTFGRRGIHAEVVLRMLLLKHVRDWSYADCLVREVRANLVYRQFTRGGEREERAGR